uniref:Stress-response A/B barrel domain-containing protein n=1 Tax=Aegilops tauschii subsp. strangulata TaxID=200361 RepID=A0A453KA11_AEGTS
RTSLRSSPSSPRSSTPSNSSGGGKDVLNQEALTQGFTHVFSMSFASAEDLAAYMGHEKHSAFAATFMAVLDKVVVLDFPFVVAKPVPSPEAA